MHGPKNKSLSAEGELMDFANSYKYLEYLNFNSQSGIYGDIREFLDALKNKGTKDTTIQIRTTGTKITNDVTPSLTPVFATFDANGDWTASNTFPE